MYYKIEKTSELGQKITKLFDRVSEARSQISEYLQYIGAQSTIVQSSDYLVGGIRGLYFDRNPDSKLYSQVRGEIGAYFPRKKTNKVIYEKITSGLPSIDRKELDSIVGFESHFVGFTHVRHVGVEDVSKYYLVVVSDVAKYTPIKGMTEILASEYKSLSNFNNE